MYDEVSMLITRISKIKLNPAEIICFYFGCMHMRSENISVISEDSERKLKLVFD